MAVHIYNNPNGDMNNPEKYWVNTGVFYSEKKKPTPDDIGALPVSGGVMTGLLNTDFVPRTNSPQFLVRTLGDGNAIGDGNTHIGYNYGTITQPLYSHYFRGKGTMYITTAGGCSVTNDLSVGLSVKAKTTITPGDYSNFDARYYTKAQSDAGYMPKVNAYTKAEADARYIQGIRVSATATRNFTPGGEWSPNDSAFVTAISMVGGMSNTGSLLVRYIQRNINGTWVNVVA